MSRSDDSDFKKDLKPLPLTTESTQTGAGTRIDLGDDLLENTAVLTVPGSHGVPETAQKRGGGAPAERSPPHVPHSTSTYADAEQISNGPITPDQIKDQMHSARILMGEGILEDAKRILRKVLLTDSSLVEARKMLEEIHETELKQIFGESDTPRRSLYRKPTMTPIEMSAELVMRGLDRDLRLGIFGEEDVVATHSTQLSLFKDRAAMEEFGAQMDRDFGGRPPTERIDLGVAFLEMGLHDLAVRHFQAAVNALTLEELNEGGTGDPVLAATGLLAYALILGGRAFEATIKLQPPLNDVDIEPPRKLDLVYLMGRACEALGKLDEAKRWFGQVAEIEPHYRDIDEKVGKLKGPGASG